jgi:guanylate cyclase 2F
MNTDVEQLKIIYALTAFTGGYHLIYIALFIPALFSLFRVHGRILSMFPNLPKEVIGNIYQNLSEKFKQSDSQVKLGTIIPSKLKILVIIVGIVIVEIACLAFLAADSVARVKGDGGAPEIVMNAAIAIREVNRASFELGETVMHDKQLGFDASVIVATIAGRITTIREAWNSLRYGVNTESGKGVDGYTGWIDILIHNDTCLESITSSIDPELYRCKNLNYLLETLCVTTETLLRRYTVMNDKEVISNLNDVHAMVTAITDKITNITAVYSDRSQEMNGLKRKLIYVFLAGLLVILGLTIPMYLFLTEEINVNHQIRSMLHYLPCELIEAIPELNQFVVSLKIGKIKRKKQDQTEKTRAILEASNDGVIICSEHGRVLELNSTAKAMFQFIDADIIGRNIISLFKEEEMEVCLKDIIKNSSRSIAKEFTAIRKNLSEYPTKVSMSTGQWEDKTIIAVFVRDCTIEFKQNLLITQEKKNSEELLLNILPGPVAGRLKRGDTCIADTVDDVTCFFSDMVGFTKMSSQMTATELVEMLNNIVNTFDDLCAYHNLEKIKTIGDAYFAVGGLHNSGSDHPERVVRFGLDIIDSLKVYNGSVQIRCGCHTGPIVAGVIGKSKFAYDVWGDTVNMASRMESNSLPGRMQCSRATYERCYDVFNFEEIPNIEIKGKGLTTCYLVVDEKNRKPSTELKKQEVGILANRITDEFHIHQIPAIIDEYHHVDNIIQPILLTEENLNEMKLNQMLPSSNIDIAARIAESVEQELDNLQPNDN